MVLKLIARGCSVVAWLCLSQVAVGGLIPEDKVRGDYERYRRDTYDRQVLPQSGGTVFESVGSAVAFLNSYKPTGFSDQDISETKHAVMRDGYAVGMSTRPATPAEAAVMYAVLKGISSRVPQDSQSPDPFSHQGCIDRALKIFKASPTGSQLWAWTNSLDRIVAKVGFPENPYVREPVLSQRCVESNVALYGYILQQSHPALSSFLNQYERSVVACISEFESKFPLRHPQGLQPFDTPVPSSYTQKNLQHDNGVLSKLTEYYLESSYAPEKLQEDQQVRRLEKEIREIKGLTAKGPAEIERLRSRARGLPEQISQLRAQLQGLNQELQRLEDDQELKTYMELQRLIEGASGQSYQYQPLEVYKRRVDLQKRTQEVTGQNVYLAFDSVASMSIDLSPGYDRQVKDVIDTHYGGKKAGFEKSIKEMQQLREQIEQRKQQEQVLVREQVEAQEIERWGAENPYHLLSERYRDLCKRLQDLGYEAVIEAEFDAGQDTITKLGFKVLYGERGDGDAFSQEHHPADIYFRFMGVNARLNAMGQVAVLKADYHTPQRFWDISDKLGKLMGRSRAAP